VDLNSTAALELSMKLEAQLIPKKSTFFRLGEPYVTLNAKSSDYTTLARIGNAEFSCSLVIVANYTSFLFEISKKQNTPWIAKFKMP